MDELWNWSSATFRGRRHQKDSQSGFYRSVCVCRCSSIIFWQTCEDPHGTMYCTDISTDQQLHQQGEELRPRLRPVPVGDGRNGVRHAGTHFADRLLQTSRQQLPNGSLSLQGYKSADLRSVTINVSSYWFHTEADRDFLSQRTFPLKIILCINVIQ